MQKSYIFLIAIILHTIYLKPCAKDTSSLSHKMDEHLRLTATLMAQPWPATPQAEKFHLGALFFLSSRIIHTKRASLLKSNSLFLLIDHDQNFDDLMPQNDQKSFAVFVSNRIYSKKKANEAIKEAIKETSKNSSIEEIFSLYVDHRYKFLPDYLNHKRVGIKHASGSIRNLHDSHSSKLPEALLSSKCNLFMTCQAYPDGGGLVRFFGVPESKKER